MSDICECIANSKLDWTPEMLVGMGFTRNDDGSGSAWGFDWDIMTPGFHLLVDPCGVVKLARRDPDSDFLTLHVCDMETLGRVVDFIQEA